MTYLRELIDRLGRTQGPTVRAPQALDDAPAPSAGLADQVANEDGRPAPAPRPAAAPGSSESVRELPDVTIRVRETVPGFFVAEFRPISPETHLARGGYDIDTAQGLRGRTIGEVLDRAEAHWLQNYPS